MSLASAWAVALYGIDAAPFLHYNRNSGINVNLGRVLAAIRNYPGATLPIWMCQNPPAAYAPQINSFIPAWFHPRVAIKEFRVVTIMVPDDNLTLVYKAVISVLEFTPTYSLCSGMPGSTRVKYSLHS